MKKLIFSLLIMNTLILANSCYDFAKIDKSFNDKIDTALFVLVDQTTLFNKNIQKQILKNATSKINKGNYIYIAKFSAFVNGYYNEKIFDFKIDYPLSIEDRYDIRKSKLKKFDKCLKEQKNYIFFKINDSINKSFLKKDESIPKSDILFAFQSFSNVISKIQAKRKIILIASDMLENSVISSFYKKGTLRKINSKKELEKVEKEDLISDFAGAEVYVIGAGITKQTSLKPSYKDSRKLLSLKKFWVDYFEKSNAKLIEMGQPLLNKIIQ